MRKYSAEKYIELVEKSYLPLLKELIETEATLINNIDNLNEKSVIDLGAGYGRIIPVIASNYKSYCGIEINKQMFSELEKRCNKIENCTAIHGDMTNLTSYVDAIQIKEENCLFLLLQNTIGTIEGDLTTLLSQIRIVLENIKNSIVISFFKSSKISTSGLELFAAISDMVGQADLKKCDFDNGFFRSNTGYEAKWWSESEIKMIIKKLSAKVISKIESDAFIIYHLKSNVNE